MNTLTIFGTIEFGRSQFKGDKISPKYIGGNGIISSLAAALYTQVDLIGVIGTDMDHRFLEKSLGKNILTQNITQMIGNTFQWTAMYDKKTQEIIDQTITFGVYAEYTPVLKIEATKKSKNILFSGSKPQLGLKVLEQIEQPNFIAVDVLFYHLYHNLAASLKLIEKATVLFCNTLEFEYLQNKAGQNLFTTFPKLNYIFHKKGKEGIDVLSRGKTRSFKPVKVIKPIDPTNAGDVFSGTVIGQLMVGKTLEDNLQEIVHIAMEQSTKVMMNDSYFRIPYNLSILDTILLEKKREVRTLHKKHTHTTRQTEIRDFSHALKKKNAISLIAEIKKASPSAGLLRKDFDPIKIAREYEETRVVDAISVLTDKKFFQGDLTYIENVKKVTTVPILRKDFILDDLQVLESYYAEADALLLIVAALTKKRLQRLITYTYKLGMHALIEVHNEKECELAISAGAKIIGINARNLKDFNIDLELFEKITKKIPAYILKVAESGIETKNDREKMYHAGANAVLVGSSIMKSNTIQECLKELTK